MARWPAAVTQALKQPSGYFFQASQQIGTSRTNDYIHGALHEALRMLFNGINNGLVPDAVPLAELPMHLEDAPLTSPAFEMYKLEAPLAIQGGAPRSGYYPLINSAACR